MLRDQLSGKAANAFGFHDDELGIVLSFIAGTAELARDDENAFTAGGPVGGAFAGDFVVCNKTLGIADLLGG